MSKRQHIVGEGSIIQAKAESPLPLDQHQALKLSQSITIERQVVLANFNDLIFKDRSLPEGTDTLHLIFQFCDIFDDLHPTSQFK